jgi:hypothetical protein
LRFSDIFDSFLFSSLRLGHARLYFSSLRLGHARLYLTRQILYAIAVKDVSLKG